MDQHPIQGKKNSDKQHSVVKCNSVVIETDKIMIMMMNNMTCGLFEIAT